MPAVKLPKKLSARLGFLAGRVRKIRTLRAVARAGFFVPLAAFACILADAYLGFPAAVRYALFGGWLALVAYFLWTIRRARTAEIDLDGIASAVEEEFPRLAERLTTAVELAESADDSNGAPALIDEVIRDADSRARKLDLAVAFPTGGVVSGFFAAMALLLLLVTPVFFAPRGGEFLRRFFAPWYTPSVRLDYKLVVTSGDPAVKRGDPVTLAAYVEATKEGARLPASAVVIVTADGKDERLPMSADEPNVWHLKRPAAEGDFDYRIEAGGAVSEAHHVTVVEPVTLAAARVTVKPPAYAAQGRDGEAAIEGLGELSALQHSTITFDLRFHPRPVTAALEFTTSPKEDAKGATTRTPVTVAADGTVRITVPAFDSGTFALTAEGQSGVKSEFPPQPLRVHPDERPKFPQVTGLGDKAKKVRPAEKIVITCAATDDVAVAKLALEWKVNDGPVQALPLDARNLNTGQAEGKISVPVTGKAKVGEKLQCRLVATDNRHLPEQKLSPQSSYFPGKDQDTEWAEFEVDPAADPLAEQEILQKKAQVEKALKEIRADVGEEHTEVDLFKRGTKTGKPLNAADQEKLRQTAKKLAETIAQTEDLARDTAVTPELARLADKISRLANEQLRDADAALSKAKDPARADEQHPQLQKAETALTDALAKIDDLLKQNEQTAQDRLDKRKLEGLADEQRDLAEKARTADPKEAAELAKKQKAIQDELNKLKEQSDAIKRAADAARADEANRLADEARRIADEMHDLNKAIDKTEKDPASDKLADLRKRQDELAKKAKELADKTDAASKAAQTQPLKPDDAAAAKAALDKGNLDDAVTAQERARQELERMARDLEEAAANARDPREAAKQLARLQDDLRRRVAQEAAKTPLDKLPAERRQALAKEQEAIAKAAARIKTPDQAAEAVKQQAAKAAADAREQLEKKAADKADRKMQEARDALDQLAGKLPTKEQRLAKAKDDLAKLKPQQDDVRQKADAAAKGAEKQDPDAPATQHDIAKKLAEAAKKQADLADQVNKLDAPGQEARKEKAADALQRAAADMTAGRTQDVAASQHSAKRELDRLEQALNGQQPADDKVAELAKKQREIADEAAKNPDKAAQADLAKKQEDVAREIARTQTPEAATAQADAADAAKKAADAGREGAREPDFAKKAKDAADKLDKLNDQVNGKETPAEAADRLAKKQRENADAQAKKPDNAGTGQARKKAAQELDELKNMRAGADAQKAKQQAQEALQKAASQMDPAANGRAQKDAADALKGLADKLAGDKQARNETPQDPAVAAEKLAKEQRDLAEQTKKEADAANQKPGEAGQQARKDAMQKAAAAQKELGKQAEKMAGRDAPKDLQQAQDAMNKAQEELERENTPGAVQKQKEAADALDKLAREAQKAKQEKADGGHPDVANQAQADAAKQLAKDQERLRDEAMKAAEEQKAQGAKQDNPAGDVAKQQQEIAKQAADLAKKAGERQGEKAEQAQQTRQAADAARQAADGAKNGDLKQAKEAGKQAAEALEKAGQDPSGGESSQKAKDLARQQADVNKKLDEMAKDGSAGKAQQAARQEQLEKQAREVGQKLDELGKPAEDGGQPSPAGQQAKEAGAQAQQAGDQLKEAKDAAKQGNGPQSGAAREGAAEAMEQAAQKAKGAAKEMSGGDKPGSPQAGKALGEAQDQMGEAGKRLGGGQPGEAGEAMDKAADALQKAAGELGQGAKGDGQGEGDGKPGQGQGGNTPGGNVGGPGGKLDLRPFSPDVAKHSGKAWGELPGEIKTKVIQEMKARYGEDYARNIKLYFEQLAERK